MSLIAIAILFLVFGVFLATVAVALMAGQQRNRSSMSKVEKKLDRFIDANRTMEERETQQKRIDAIEQENRIATEKYEYGGC